MPNQKSFANGTEFPPLADGVLRLYSMRFCPYAQRTRLVLAHKNISFETVNVHLRPVESKPDWFLKRNPQGMVPVLEKDGHVVYESVVCNEYLDAVYPEKRLTPSDPYQQALDKMLFERYSKAVGLYYKLFMTNGSDEVYQELLSALQPVEQAIAERGSFFGGDTVSMLDYNIWPHIERFPALSTFVKKDILTAEKFPKLHAWFQRMMSLQVVKDCFWPQETHIKFFQSFFQGTPNFDLGLEA